MTSIQADLPDSLYQTFRDLAEQEGIPVEQLVGLALARAVGAWSSQRNLLRERAQKGSREKFLAAMSKVPNVAPLAGDELPE